MFQKIKLHINSLSKATFFLLFITVVGTTFFLKKWEGAETKDKLISWDVISYYSYLPAVFIHNDIKLDFIDTEEVNYVGKHQFWPIRLNQSLEKDSNGHIKVIKTTMGMSFLYAPFFFIGHSIAHFSDYETNGFSKPYEFVLVMSCLFYFIIGLFYLRKILLLNFSELATSLTMITIVMGTNLFYYVIEDSAISHAYSFSLIICFLYHSILWLKNQSLKRAIYLGLLGGLIVLIRPVNILIFVFPLFYGILSKQEFITRVRLLIRYKKHLLIIGLLSFLVLLPQFIYWKYITGTWLFNSYVGETFYFGNPHILEGLFSYRNGWLLYTPIMIFSIIGMVFQFKHNKKYFLATSLFFALNTYVMYSWWCWWYGGSFGSRPMIDSYGLFAIPIACFYSVALKKKYLTITVFFIGFFLISLNQFQTFQRRRSLIHWDSMTKKAYWHVFFKPGLAPEDWGLHDELLQAPDYSKAIKGEKEYEFDPF